MAVARPAQSDTTMCWLSLFCKPFKAFCWAVTSTGSVPIARSPGLLEATAVQPFFADNIMWQSTEPLCLQLLIDSCSSANSSGPIPTSPVYS
jgi:hypothetical protein